MPSRIILWLAAYSRTIGLTESAPPKPGFPPSLKPGCLPGDGQTDLWCPGDNGYGCYKIPSLLRVPNSTTLLAFVEARKHSCDDEGYIDLLLRRSLDNGKTWLPVQTVHANSSEQEWHTVGDALPVYDVGRSTIHVIFTRDNTDVFVTDSVDSGATWAKPRNITSVAVRQRGKFVGTGHAGGVQLASGRLLVPMYGGGLHSFVLASDDSGGSWRITGTLDSGNEWTFAEVRKGSGHLIASLRQSLPSRLQAFSSDGGDTWTPTYRNPPLVDEVGGCEGAMILHPNGRLYYSHPEAQFLRQSMAIKVSADGGRTWEHHRTVWGRGAECDEQCVPAAGYSSLAVLGDDLDSDIGIFYGRNNVSMLLFEARGMTFTSVPASDAMIHI